MNVLTTKHISRYQATDAWNHSTVCYSCKPRSRPYKQIFFLFSHSVLIARRRSYEWPILVIAGWSFFKRIHTSLPFWVYFFRLFLFLRGLTFFVENQFSPVKIIIFHCCENIGFFRLIAGDPKLKGETTLNNASWIKRRRDSNFQMPFRRGVSTSVCCLFY